MFRLALDTALFFPLLILIPSSSSPCPSSFPILLHLPRCPIQYLRMFFRPCSLPFISCDPARVMGSGMEPAAPPHLTSLCDSSSSSSLSSSDPS
eukprot:3139579-Pyramimonas_sp.AAC.2